MKTLIRLTPAQRSALECADLNDTDTPVIYNQAWRGGWILAVEPGTVDRLCDELNALSNSEDAQAQDGQSTDRKYAARAARALATLMTRARKAVG